MVTKGTAEESPLTPEKFKTAADAVEQFLHANLHEVSPVPAEALSSYREQGHVFVQGWEFTADFDGAQMRLRVLADQDFPFSPVRIGIVPPHEYAFAHLEAGSLLCLDPEQSVCWDKPAEVVGELLSQAADVIDTGLASIGSEDETRREILAYWDKSQGRKLAKGILAPDAPARMVHMIRHNGQIILSDNRDEAKSFFAASGGKLKPTQFGEKVPLLWLRRPPANSQLPVTVANLVRLLLDETASGLGLLEQYLVSSKGRNTVVLAFRDDNGVGFIGVEFAKVRFQKSAPTSLAFIRQADRSNKVERISIRREDAEWVFGRDQNVELDKLRTANIAMVGVGSLGSYVALSLASAGVGRIELIDPQVIMAENTSRHVLGANYIGMSKSEALALRLRSQFKVSEFTSFAGTWQSWVASDKTDLASYDLVISTIGDWPSEAHLANHLNGYEADIPSLFAWLEPRAIGSQAVFLPAKSPCFFCGFTTGGLPTKAITTWANPTRTRTPLCGGHFQSYGATALMAHSSQVADQAIKALLGELEEPTCSFQAFGNPNIEGGEWSEWWANLHSGNVPEACRIELPWEVNPSCGNCGGAA
ncbi:MAG: ThiF family adenylyltransferase [Pseudomonadota bacterium]